MPMNEYRLRVGNAVIALFFRNERESRAIGNYFNRASSEAEPDICLSLSFLNTRSRNADVPNSLFLTKTGDGNGFSTAGGLIQGRYSPASGEGELVVQRLITRGSYSRVYEQIFYQAYWSAVRRKGANSFLLHSSGIIRKGQGFAFTGKSGSGKSTVASLCVDDLVLNDEITVIDLAGDPAGTCSHHGIVPVIRDTPFNGYFMDKQEGSAPLAGIMLLNQAPHHRITPTTTINDVKTLTREIIPPMGLETPLTPAVYMDMIDCAERTRAAVSLYTMEFLPDSGFGERLDELGKG